MDFIELKVENINSIEESEEAHILILKEKEGARVMLVMIGLNEARSLVLALNKTASRRPTTHDLFTNLATLCGYMLENVYIYNFEDGVYSSFLRMRHHDGSTFEMDSRTSDAVTLALLHRVPIYIKKSLFDVVGVMAGPSTGQKPMGSPFILEEAFNNKNYIFQRLTEMSTEELQSVLREVVEKEDFEFATKIYEELEKRKNNEQ